MIRIVPIDLRKLPLLLRREGIDPLHPDLDLPVLRRVQRDQRNFIRLNEVEDRLIVAELDPPILNPDLSELLVAELPLQPLVQLGLRRSAEHLHPDGDLPRKPVIHRLENLELDPMIFEVVMNLADVDDPGGGQEVDQLILRDGNAGTEMNDLSLLNLIDIDIGRFGGE